MNPRQKTALIALLAALAAAWILLFFSSKAVLVWGEKPDEQVAIGFLECTYFTGTGFIDQRHLYSESGVLGKAACPRLIDL